jgi:hypothetical protein
MAPCVRCRRHGGRQCRSECRHRAQRAPQSPNRVGRERAAKHEDWARPTLTSRQRSPAAHCTSASRRGARCSPEQGQQRAPDRRQPTAREHNRSTSARPERGRSERGRHSSPGAGSPADRRRTAGARPSRDARRHGSAGAGSPPPAQQPGDRCDRGRSPPALREHSREPGRPGEQYREPRDAPQRCAPRRQRSPERGATARRRACSSEPALHRGSDRDGAPHDEGGARARASGSQRTHSRDRATGAAAERQAREPEGGRRRRGGDDVRGGSGRGAGTGEHREAREAYARRDRGGSESPVLRRSGRGSPPAEPERKRRMGAERQRRRSPPEEPGRRRRAGAERWERSGTPERRRRASAERDIPREQRSGAADAGCERACDCRDFP